MQPGKRLVNKVAIVTGGASGIGAETARVSAARRQGMPQTTTRPRRRWRKRYVIVAGQRRSLLKTFGESQWSMIVAQAEKSYGRLDILCNIAGISGRDPKMNIQTGLTAGPRLAEQTLKHWNWVAGD
jgi:NAD(P)-dependent dehydrogenase (short-subunit alcohol dehydrogenase family)